ncbi:hemolysin-type calcium-binding repeat family protein [Microcystis aeruginosa FACHB-905 = DIANCHI905]|nr:hemolysin-type calcium-binding repeat family protein [Microcystis aeruginosa FACHB-905 = DIANCHI905]
MAEGFLNALEDSSLVFAKDSFETAEEAVADLLVAGFQFEISATDTASADAKGDGTDNFGYVDAEVGTVADSDIEVFSFATGDVLATPDTPEVALAMGSDTYFVNSTGDIVVELSDEGTDRVNSLISYDLGDNLEILTLQGSASIDGSGNALDNVINGNSGSNMLKGGAGADILRGNNGNDVLIGGAGSDRLEGGAGTDRFEFAEGDYSLSSKFMSADESPMFVAVRDVIVGYASGEVVDLSRLDANSVMEGDQAFVNASNAAFNLTGVQATGNAGTLRISGGNATNGIINLYIDDDATADMSIQFIGVNAANIKAALDAGNIIL